MQNDLDLNNYTPDMERSTSCMRSIQYLTSMLDERKTRLASLTEMILDSTDKVRDLLMAAELGLAGWQLPPNIHQLIRSYVLDRPTSFVLLTYEDDHYHYTLTLNLIDDGNSFEPLLARHDTEGSWTVFDAGKNGWTAHNSGCSESMVEDNGDFSLPDIVFSDLSPEDRELAIDAVKMICHGLGIPASGASSIVWEYGPFIRLYCSTSSLTKLIIWRSGVYLVPRDEESHRGVAVSSENGHFAACRRFPGPDFVTVFSFKGRDEALSYIGRFFRSAARGEDGQVLFTIPLTDECTFESYGTIPDVLSDLASFGANVESEGRTEAANQASIVIEEVYRSYFKARS